MIHFQRVMEGVAVQPLIEALERQPDLWDAHRLRKDAPGSPHCRMSDVWIRYNAIERLDPENPAAFNEEHIPVWYPAYAALPELRPILFGLMAAAEGEMLGGVLITRIPPGEGIGLHADNSWHVQYYPDKFYLTLQNATGSVFGCRHRGAEELLCPHPGEIWRFDNRKLHWVENQSNEDRITLIVCIRTAKYGST